MISYLYFFVSWIILSNAHTEVPMGSSRSGFRQQDYSVRTCHMRQLTHLKNTQLISPYQGLTINGLTEIFSNHSPQISSHISYHLLETVGNQCNRFEVKQWTQRTKLEDKLDENGELYFLQTI